MEFKFLPHCVLMLAALIWGDARAQDAGELARLKKAGISDTTLALIIKEKIIPTQALSVDEIISLKQDGMSADTLALIIRSASFMGQNTTRVYGDLTRTIESLSVNDLIRLKAAGVSDEVLRSVVVYRSAESSAADKARAWEMLKNMDITLLLK